MPYVPLPRAPQPAPPSLPWQMAAWFFSLLFNNPRATVAIVMFVVMLFLKSQGDTQNRHEDRRRDTPVPVEPSRASEAPRSFHAEPSPPLEAAPELANASAPLAADASGAVGPGWTDLSNTETYMRDAAEAVANNRVRDYAQAMTALYTGAYRRSSTVTSGSDALDAHYQEFMRDVSGHSRLERQSLIKSLQRTLEKDPTAAEPAFRLGCLSLADGGRLGAREYFVRAIWADPNHAAAWYAYGAIATDDTIALGAMANAGLVSNSENFQPLQAKVSSALLDSANVDSHRVAQLLRMARRLARPGQIGSARTAAEWNAKLAAGR